MTVVSGNICSCGYFVGIPCIHSASNDSELIENVDFQCFYFETLRNEANIIIEYYLVPFAFALTTKYMTLNGHFT